MSTSPDLETCPHCLTWRGHSSTCPTLSKGRYGVVDELTPEINTAVGYDDRKELAAIWQDFAPLPTEGLTERVYDALLHVAKYGAREALEARDA